MVKLILKAFPQEKQDERGQLPSYIFNSMFENLTSIMKKKKRGFPGSSMITTMV